MRILLVLIIVPFLSFGQISDDLLEQKILSKYNVIFDDYNAQVKQNVSCFIGKPTTNNDLQGSGHAFYGTGNWEKATVLSKGVAFDLKYLRYDIKNSSLITLQFLTDGPRYIALFPDNIESFILDGRYFRYILRTVFPGKHKLESKYYEVLYEKDSLLLVKNWQKVKNTSTTSNFAVFSEVSSLLVIKNGKLFKVSAKKDFFEIFEKDELLKIEQYANSRGYSFKENIEKEVAEVLAYFYK